MDIKEFINKVCQEIKYEPVKKGISEELTSHIQDIKEEYINKGIQEKEAEEKAVSQMGIAEDIGRNGDDTHHHPRIEIQSDYCLSKGEQSIQMAQCRSQVCGKQPHGVHRIGPHKLEIGIIVSHIPQIKTSVYKSQRIQRKGEDHDHLKYSPDLLSCVLFFING